MEAELARQTIIFAPRLRQSGGFVLSGLPRSPASPWLAGIRRDADSEPSAARVPKHRTGAFSVCWIVTLRGRAPLTGEDTVPQAADREGRRKPDIESGVGPQNDIFCALLAPERRLRVFWSSMIARLPMLGQAFERTADS